MNEISLDFMKVWVKTRLCMKIIFLLGCLGTHWPGNVLSAQNFRLLLEGERRFLNHDFQNPENILQQPHYNFYSVLLYNDNFKLGKSARLQMDLRGEMNYSHILSDRLKKDDRNDVDFDFRPIELYYVYSDDQFSISIGRKKIKWGVGYVSNPTAIVSKPPGPDDSDDHLYRITGNDVIQMTFAKSKRQLDVLFLPATENNKTYAKQNAFALRYYRFINPFDVSLVGRLDQRLEYQTGINTAVTIGNAIELHGEFLFESFNQVSYPESVDSFTFRSSDKKPFRYLLGGQWSPSRKINFALEYLYAHNGYTPAQWMDYRTMIDRLHEQHFIPQFTHTADSLLNQIGTTTGPIMRDYLFGRVYFKNIPQTFEMEWVSLTNLKDMSTLVRIANRLRFNEQSNFQIFMHNFFRIGSEKSEFAERLNRYTFRIGFNWLL